MRISYIRSHWFVFASTVFVLMLFAKFFYPLFAFDIPLGYDPGMYRYLFIKYADAFPFIRYADTVPFIKFALPELRPWAQEYPYGLFLISSMLIRLGVPVSWFLGWIWSVFAVCLLGVYAWIFAKREGKAVGVLVLLFGALSIAYFDGFAQMYWKTYLALLFLVITFRFVEKKSLFMIPFGALTIFSHNQTGLILGLTLAVWWFAHLPSGWNDPKFRRLTAAFAAAAVLGLIFYWPIFFRAFWAPFKSLFLLRGNNAPAGHFPDAVFFIKNGFIILSLGIYGLARSFKRDRFALWQIAPLICAIFIVFKLVFYNRFFLQFDFFLIPFAAIGIVDILSHVRGRRTLDAGHWAILSAILAALTVQSGLSFRQMLRWEPRITQAELDAIKQIPEFVEEDAKIIALENNSATWLLGWLPEYYTGGPGLFDFPPWTYGDWEKFLYGSHEDRLRLLPAIKERPLYLMTSGLFYNYYGEYVKGFLEDECFEEVSGAPLLKVVCEADSG